MLVSKPNFYFNQKNTTTIGCIETIRDETKVSPLFKFTRRLIIEAF